MSEYLTRQEYTERPTCLGAYACDTRQCPIREALLATRTPGEQGGHQLSCPHCSAPLRRVGYVSEQLVKVGDDGRVLPDPLEGIVGAPQEDPLGGPRGHLE